MTDIRQSLLRRDALSAAKEVLYHLNIYFSGQLQNAAGPAVDNASVELVDEFIFLIPKDRNAPRKKMSSLQELQLLEVMCSYFQEQSKDSLRQVVFSALFVPQGNETDGCRMSMLGKLVSMAVAVCRVPILDCAALWLQRTNATHCVRLAKVLVDDYCGSVLSPGQALQHIVTVSPLFCCQLITAVTALYDLSTDDLIPSSELLEMVVTWIYDDPGLTLLSFLNAPVPPSRTPGSLDLTPLLGLIRWCVKSPLACKRHRNLSPMARETAEGDGGPESLYSKLHLSVLQNLMLLQAHLKENDLYGRLGILSVEQVAKLVGELARLADELKPLNAAKEIELSLNRLAQLLQVAMAAGALLCSREDLRCLCSRLPKNNLLQLVMSGPALQPTHSVFYPASTSSSQGYPPRLTPVTHPALPSAHTTFCS
ncbi:uncharacterized protein C7orf26-like [Megalops cyprinoides]|uniref:uncharacterized protein C7orf26-like n=1 Tax=Megalops cyprinoides TaxID=118141 RepID=UPI001864D719|nr:uncharacterized protein C7orf26-like [Megalops cyprinoides]